MAAPPWTKHSFAAMGTHVTVDARTDLPQRVHGDVEGLFGRVQRACTRFEASSDLSRANSDPDGDHIVSSDCLEVVHAAHRAYLETSGLFDPRILESLVTAGYDRTFDELIPSPAPRAAGDALTSTWQPQIDVEASRVALGGRPVDLGGIGKGWTVDAAVPLVAAHATDFLVNAGGDLTVRGDGPTDTGWTVAVEDPRDLTLTIAVLRLRDISCATSSTGRRTWRSGNEVGHHLIDPRTGRPARGGVASVTVVADTTTTAETWSKALLIAGADEIESLAQSRGLAAYWVLDDGRTAFSEAMASLVIWERP